MVPVYAYRLISAKRCEYEGKQMTIMNWARSVSGWSAVNIYDWVKHADSGRKLEEFRAQLEQQAEAEGDSYEAPET